MGTNRLLKGGAGNPLKIGPTTQFFGRQTSFSAKHIIFGKTNNFRQTISNFCPLIFLRKILSMTGVFEPFSNIYVQQHSMAMEMRSLRRGSTAGDHGLAQLQCPVQVDIVLLCSSGLCILNIVPICWGAER